MMLNTSLSKQFIENKTYRKKRNLSVYKVCKKALQQNFTKPQKLALRKRIIKEWKFVTKKVDVILSIKYFFLCLKNEIVK